MDKDTKSHMDKFENQGKVIRTWEELQFNKNKFGLRYDKIQFDFFYILDYSKPMKFVSVGFLDDDLHRHIIKNRLDELPKVDHTNE